MLVSLRMKNIALIESLSLSFSDGLHVLSGETGAGKSIVVDAVNLVLGGRAERELIRTGTDKAWVEAVFDPRDSAAVAARLGELGVESEGYVTLYRELTRTGRSLCRVCGTVLPLSALRQLAALLMDVHGQHEHQFLTDERFHLQTLDGSGDEAHQALLAETAAACEAFLACHRQYGRLVRDSEQKEWRMERLKQSLEELEKAKLKPGEEEALTRERERSRHAEKISAALLLAYSRLAAGEGSAALPLVKTALGALQGIEGLDPRYQQLSGRLASLYYELEELGYELNALLQADAFDPRRAEQVDLRLELIRRMERKYGATEAEVLAEQERMQQEYDNYASMDRQLAALAAEDRRLLARYREAAARLSASRAALARQFEQRMMEQLGDLGMEKTVFRVQLSGRGSGKPPMPSPLGDDLASFLISPNPGEPLKPLAKIASGGELSRLMLALKALEADRGGVDTMVFDEIDTGISGRMAQVVAEKMALIARRHQVICVTHLPQIAAMADHQFLVEKQVDDGRTNTRVLQLSQEERVGEIARMLGGADGSADSARSHAAQMLQAAHRQG